MNNKSRHFSPNRITIKNARNEFINSPLKYKKRRKSSIPLQLREFIKNNGFNQINTDASTKNCKKVELSGKKFYVKNIINSSIPEESENSSNNKKDQKTKVKRKQIKKETKNEIENNNYYIHYIKNIYEKEPHLNQENILKSEKKKTNDDYKKFLEGKKFFRKHRRRNSELSNIFLKSNLHNINFNMDKEPKRSSIKSSTIIDKQKNTEMAGLIHKKNVKEKIKSNRKNKEKKHKNKENHDDKEDKDNLIYNLNCDSPKKSVGSINIKKKVKENEILEIEKKIENGYNNENKNIKNHKKMNKLKRFFCCLINKCESSTEID